MSKYDKMLELNKRKSEEKVERAVLTIRTMVLEREKVSVPALMQKTGLSRGFFYKNPIVRGEIDAAMEQQRVPVGLVTFAPGTINAYHIHHKGGQILLVTGGRGWYQEEGKPARELKAGDVVNISPEVKHWHGAAKDSWFQHLAVEVPAEGASNEWLEFLPEEEYDKLP